MGEMINEIERDYNKLMENFRLSEFVNKEWPMVDGMYQQYSAFSVNEPCPTGTISAL